MILHAVTILNTLDRMTAVYVKDARRWPKRGAGMFFLVPSSTESVVFGLPKPLRFRDTPTIETEPGVTVTLDLRD